MATYIQHTCPLCDKIFDLPIKVLNQAIKRGHKCHCSKKCSSLTKRNRKEVNCLICNLSFYKIVSQIRGDKHFCSQSHAAIYNNTHKTKGIRRSKLEIWIESQLSARYPNLEILYNSKQVINSELDIYIPALKLAFELNGIFHYEPIFGQDKLNQISCNDNRKFQACLEMKIALCIIDVSSLLNFKENKAIRFLDIITKVINSKVIREEGLEPPT